MVVLMTLRDNTYLQFGPLLLEAIADAVLEQLNELRTDLGKPTITKAAFLGTLNNNLNHLPPYDWMTHEPIP
jgi:hypothetical protein